MVVVDDCSPIIMPDGRGKGREAERQRGREAERQRGRVAVRQCGSMAVLALATALVQNLSALATPCIPTYAPYLLYCVLIVVLLRTQYVAADLLLLTMPIWSISRPEYPLR
jgi:hypothetical protein